MTLFDLFTMFIPIVPAFILGWTLGYAKGKKTGLKEMIPILSDILIDLKAAKFYGDQLRKIQGFLNKHGHKSPK